MADAWDNKEFSEAMKYTFRDDYSKIGEFVSNLLGRIEELERKNAELLEPIDTGNLAGDSLYKALDDLYGRGWKDRHKERDWDPRGCKEWQVPIDLFRANISILQQENAELKKSVFDMYTIVEAVAHIGVDFGYGKYELEPSHIDAARKILEVTNET